MMPLSPAMAGVLRHAIEAQFDHVYTRIPRAVVDNDPSTPSDESSDVWGDQQYQAAVGIPALPCHLQQPRSQTMVLPQGLTNIVVPILVVPWTDPIAEGDGVSQVLGPADQGGNRTLLLAGPVEVESVTEVSPGMPGPLCRQVQLRVIETV